MKTILFKIVCALAHIEAWCRMDTTGRQITLEMGLHSMPLHNNRWFNLDRLGDPRITGQVRLAYIARYGICCYRTDLVTGEPTYHVDFADTLREARLKWVEHLVKAQEQWAQNASESEIIDALWKTSQLIKEESDIGLGAGFTGTLLKALVAKRDSVRSAEPQTVEA